jgi:hypothetical protein
MHRPMTTFNAFSSTFAVFPDTQNQLKKLQKSYQTNPELNDIQHTNNDLERMKACNKAFAFVDEQIE